MKQRWTFRCYPTPEQAEHLNRTFGCARFVYNWALEQRTAAFARGERMGYVESSSALTALKTDPERLWLNEVSSVPLQQALRQLQTAFRNFFEKRTKYPAFHRKDGKQTAEYTRSAFRFDLGSRQLHLAKIGALKVRWSRKVETDPSTVTVIRKPSGRYFVSLVVDAVPAPLPETGASVGVDFGVMRLATLSTGERVGNPKNAYRYHRMMKRRQQALARKVKGSNRYRMQRQKIARLHERIANARNDVASKFAWNLVTRFDTICIESLNLRGMVKNHNLARSLNDAAIGTMIRAIEAKAAMHGKTVIKVDRWFPSSKLCSVCGTLRKNMPLSVRRWACECGASHDRDENAARNILAAGQAVAGRGADVSLH